MIFKTGLTSEERVTFLKDNKEEIIIGFTCRGYGSDLKKGMTIILEWVENENFYSNFLNSFKGVDSEDLFNIIDEQGLLDERVESDGLTQKMEDMREKAFKNQSPSSMR